VVSVVMHFEGTGARMRSNATGINNGRTATFYQCSSVAEITLLAFPCLACMKLSALRADGRNFCMNRPLVDQVNSIENK
jgi:hypothetical protein